MCQNSHASKQRQIRPCSPYIVYFGQMATQQLSCLTQRTLTTTCKWDMWLRGRQGCCAWNANINSLTPDVCAVRECLNPLYHFMFSLSVITTLASMEQARRSTGEVWRSTQTAISMWYAAPSHTEVITDLEKFVVRFVYGDTKSKTVGDVRAAKWRAQKKKSTIRLLPDSDSLRQHLERANYLADLLKHYQLQSHPSPIGHGWHLVNGLCLPDRSTQPLLPPSMPLPPKPRTKMLSDDRSDSEDSDCDSCSSYSDSESFGDSEAPDILRTVISHLSVLSFLSSWRTTVHSIPASQDSPGSNLYSRERLIHSNMFKKDVCQYGGQWPSWN